MLLQEAEWFKSQVLQKLDAIEKAHNDRASAYREDFDDLSERLTALTIEVASFRLVKTAVFTLIGMILSIVFIALLSSVVVSRSPSAVIQTTYPPKPK